MANKTGREYTDNELARMRSYSDMEMAEFNDFLQPFYFEAEDKKGKFRVLNIQAVQQAVGAVDQTGAIYYFIKGRDVMTDEGLKVPTRYAEINHKLNCWSKWKLKQEEINSLTTLGTDD